MLVIIIWIIIIKNLLGRRLEWCSQASPLVLSSLLIFSTNEKKNGSSLIQIWAFRTCPSLSWWSLVLGAHTKAVLWAGGPEGPGRVSLLCCFSPDSPPGFLSPELCVWPSWRRVSANDSLSRRGHGCLHLPPFSQPCCLGLGVGWGRGSGEGRASVRNSLGVVVSIVPAVLLAHHSAAVSHLPNEAGL